MMVATKAMMMTFSQWRALATIEDGVGNMWMGPLTQVSHLLKQSRSFVVLFPSKSFE